MHVDLCSACVNYTRIFLHQPTHTYTCMHICAHTNTHTQKSYRYLEKLHKIV